MRLGSTPAAPFVGGQFASLYVGSTRVRTVPGKPVITSAVYITLFGVTRIEFSTPGNDGGSTITALRFYIDGELVSPVGGTGSVRNFGGDLTGQEASMSAVNEIGEGPLSDPVVVPAE